jgi:hypothetical protein
MLNEACSTKSAEQILLKKAALEKDVLQNFEDFQRRVFSKNLKKAAGALR